MQPKKPRTPMSPRLKPPKTTIPQGKIDSMNASYLSIAHQKLMTLPPSAQSPVVLCLDLEDNRMCSSALQRIGKNVGSLNLARNPLLDLRLPLLKGLRSLSIDYCGLSTLKGIPQFPHLRFLSAVGNKLENFNGLPIFGKLESINVSGNPGEFTSKITIAAVGSVFLHTFNDVELTEEDMREAFKLSPLVGVALRMGRDVTPQETPEDEVREAQKFLTRDLVKLLQSQGMSTDITTLNITMYDGDACLVCPWESPSVRWYRSAGGKGREWEVMRDEEGAGKRPSNIIPLTMMMRMHLIKCEFVLKDKIFAVYTDWPVGREANDLNMPFPLDAVIAGLPIEGSLVSLIPSDRPGRVAWTREDETLAEDVQSIRLTHDDVGKNVTCLMQPYCPYFPNVTFATVFVETGIVEPQIPTVTGVEFPPHIIEGQKITFTRKVFPDREGASQILVERANSPSGEWFLLAELEKECLEYTPTTSDIGHFLRVSYVPVTVEGDKGEPTFFYSLSRVLPSLPVFKSAAIGGLPKTFYPMCAVCDYYGGRKGRCAYNWYFSKKPITDTNMRALEKVAEGTMYFTPQKQHAKGYLAIEMLPVREDEVVGNIVCCALVEPIVLDDPPEPLEDAPTEARVGETIQMNTTVSFFVSDGNGFCGFKEVKRGTSFKPRSKHAGKILRIVADKSDHIVGEIKPAIPQVTKVEIEYEKPHAGMTATVLITEKNLAPDGFELLWIRCQGDIEKVVGVDTAEYTLQKEDIGFQLKVRVTPIDHEGKYLPYTESKLTPSIQLGVVAAPKIVSDEGKSSFTEGSLVQLVYDKDVTDITWLKSDPKEGWIKCRKSPDDDFGNQYRIKVADIGRYIRCQFKVGNSVLFATTEDVVRPVEPSMSVLIAPENQEVYEGDVLKPIIQYVGGREGTHKYQWSKPDLFKQKILGDGPTYTVKSSDVDAKITFTVTPVRSDKKQGTPVTIEYSPVMAKPPTVTDVTVKQNAQGFIECNGTYSGGKEGDTIYEWNAIDPDGNETTIGKTPENCFFPPPQLNGYLIECKYRPAREDGVRGEGVVSSNRVKVEPLPLVDSVDILVKNGRVEVGQVMRCKAVCNDGSKPEYQWYRGDGASQWEIIEGATSQDYTPCDMDEGYILCCLVEPVNSKGWRGRGISASTPDPVEPPEGQLTIVARRNKYWSGTELTTNFKVEVRWERVVDGEHIIVGMGAKYLLTADDVGYKLVAMVDGMLSKPTPVVEINPEISSYVKPVIRARAMRFSAKAKVGKSVWNIQLDGLGVTMKGKNGVVKTANWNTVNVQCVAETNDEMVLWLDASTKFVLIPSFNSDLRLAKATANYARDFAVLIIRGIGKA